MKFYLIGGFLGSGKTTAIKAACNVLSKANVKAAVVTNDQGEKLVDTAFLQEQDIPVMQITNGCFCCRYNELAAAIGKIKLREHPEIIFAESVGSCTDLIATVAKPLQAAYPETPVVISIFADASLLFSLLTGNASFLNDEVRYIYKKQLEEADLLMINKVDLLTSNETLSLNQVLKEQYAAKQLLFQNSYDERHVEHWLRTMANFQSTDKRKSLEIDYDTYARGEASMAWLDEELEIESNTDAAEIAYRLIDNLQSAIRDQGLVIGHLKFLLNDGTRQQKVSITTRVETEELPTKLLLPTRHLQMLINARVQATPELLQQLVADVVNNVLVHGRVRICIKSSVAFRPGYPQPIHRIAV